MDGIKSIEDFYRETSRVIPEEVGKEIGHFNVFRIDEVVARYKQKNVMPYNRRAYYKISLINGHNRAEYADKVIDIEKHALLFATPKVPYNYYPLDDKQSGCFCIFTEEFLLKNKTGINIDSFPLFQPGGYPVFQVGAKEVKAIDAIFRKMFEELSSDYAYKYDLLRNYVLELIHFGQKLQPVSSLHPQHSASARVTSLFIELLERQFPIASQQQRLSLCTPKDYSERLSVHVNHLNKVLKEHTSKTTTELIAGRITQEAKILLRQTSWSVSEIAWALGFEEVAHFSNFFKKQTTFTPVAFRSN